MNRHTIRGKIKRALCALWGHDPEYDEEERDSEGWPVIVLVVKTWVCGRCGHLLDQQVERKRPAKYG